MLAARDIHVCRGGRTLLAGAELTVSPGELVALIGPNGAGKSTLVHALSAAIRPAGGTVTLDGRTLADWSPTALARRRAVLPQTPELGFPLTVREVAALGRSPHAGCCDRATDACRVAAALAEAGIDHLAERAYPTLSGGVRQRVQLARVLAQLDAGATDATDGRYLLLDEPTNNLDIAYQRRVVDTAFAFSRRGNGVLAVLHDPNLAAMHADRIVVLVAGSVLASGPPESVMTAAQLRTAFDARVTVQPHPVNGRPYMLPC